MRLQTVVNAISSMSPSVTSSTNATFAEDDSLEEEFADIAILSEDDRDWRLPQPKRVKLAEANSKPTSSEPEKPGDQDLVAITHDNENKPLSCQNSRRPKVQVRIPPSNFPHSIYDGWPPPLTPTPEHIALKELLVCLETPSQSPSHCSLHLLSFAIHKAYM